MYQFKLASKLGQEIIDKNLKNKSKFAVYSAKGILIGYISKKDNNDEENTDFIQDYLVDNSFEDINTRLSILC